MNTFKKDNEIEYLLKLIKHDSSIPSKLDIEELEQIAEYLANYKQTLLDTQGA